jgi:cytochrome b561
MRDYADRYGPGTILLHWLIAMLILGLIGLGFLMTRPGTDPALQFSLYQWHKSFGMLVLLLAAVRFVHSLFGTRVRLPNGLGPIERRMAKTTHMLLASLAVLAPLAGWALASASPLEIPTFAFNLVAIPHLPLPKSDAGEAFWSTVHATLAYSILVLVALHAAAALYHHYGRHDDVLLRIMGRTRPPVVTPSTEQPS